MSLKISLDLATEPNVISARRVFDAPRALVFAAWTDMRHLAQWWGPVGFSTTTRSADFRTGGAWRFVMHGPDGTDYENRIVFDEVMPPERLVYRHGGADEAQPASFKVTVLFAEDGERTQLTMRMEFASAQARDEVIAKHGADKGLAQTLQRLEDFLRSTPSLLSGETRKPLQVQPYLFLDGRAGEAIEFYKSALGARVEMLMRMQDSPEPPPPGRLPEGCEGKVMHASIRIGDTTLMLSDGLCAGAAEFKGFSLSIALPSVEEAESVFAALSNGGRVQAPLTKTFFSPCFGMVYDRFGIGWMVNAQA